MTIQRIDHLFFRRRLCLCVLSCLYFTLPMASALATTKGLSQIVTPDVQPQGDLSLSFQWQGKEIANPYEFQAELGITRSFEVSGDSAVRNHLWVRSRLGAERPLAFNRF
jgi:hypothetical protein